MLEKSDFDRFEHENERIPWAAAMFLVEDTRHRLRTVQYYSILSDHIFLSF